MPFFPCPTPHVVFRLPKHFRNARQRVSITGLGSKHFDDALGGLLHVRSLFTDVVPPNALQDPLPRRAGGMAALEFSNRYFASDQAISNDGHRPLDSSIDPLQILTNLCPTQVTSNDNDVLYYERLKHASGSVHIYVASLFGDLPQKLPDG